MNVFEVWETAEDVLIDLGYVSSILDQVCESFSLDKKNWDQKEICKMIENHSQLATMLNLCIKLIGDSAKQLDNIRNNDIDSDESEAPVDTSMNQK